MPKNFFSAEDLSEGENDGASSDGDSEDSETRSRKWFQLQLERVSEQERELKELGSSDEDDEEGIKKRFDLQDKLRQRKLARDAAQEKLVSYRKAINTLEEKAAASETDESAQKEEGEVPEKIRLPPPDLVFSAVKKPDFLAASVVPSKWDAKEMRDQQRYLATKAFERNSLGRRTEADENDLHRVAPPVAYDGLTSQEREWEGRPEPLVKGTKRITESTTFAEAGIRDKKLYKN